jgi:hypothetical protein
LRLFRITARPNHRAAAITRNTSATSRASSQPLSRSARGGGSPCFRASARRLEPGGWARRC